MYGSRRDAVNERSHSFGDEQKRGSLGACEKGIEQELPIWHLLACLWTRVKGWKEVWGSDQGKTLSQSDKYVLSRLIPMLLNGKIAISSSLKIWVTCRSRCEIMKLSRLFSITDHLVIIHRNRAWIFLPCAQHCALPGSVSPWLIIFLASTIRRSKYSKSSERWVGNFP